MDNETTPQYPRIDGFKGINNRIDPIRLGMEYQLQADNVLCDDAGVLIRRPGINSFLLGDYQDLYGTQDGLLLAIDSSNRLVKINETGETTILNEGVTGAPFAWVELGYALFLMSQHAQWAIYPDRVIRWGSLCPSAAVTTYPISDPVSYPPPVGHVLCARRSQIAIGVWEAHRDRSVLYLSRPDYPHEFRLDKDWQIFAGRINLLASTAQGMVIGTDRAIYIDPYDSALVRVAEYGVPLDSLISDERDSLYFWSERGLCRAIPFENLTDKVLAVTERTTVTAGLLNYQGSRYAVVQQNGPVVTRRRMKPYEPLTASITHTQGITP